MRCNGVDCTDVDASLKLIRGAIKSSGKKSLTVHMANVPTKNAHDLASLIDLIREASESRKKNKLRVSPEVKDALSAIGLNLVVDCV